MTPGRLITMSDTAFGGTNWPIVLAGCVLAATIALSPVTIVSGVLLIVIVSATCRDLNGGERKVVLGILLVAIGLRVAMIAVLFLLSNPDHLVSFPFDGDGRYMKQRALWLRNIWLGISVGPKYYTEAFGPFAFTGYLYIIAYLQYLLGPAPYAVHLLSVCWSVAAAVLLHRLVRRLYGASVAIVALVLMMFLPTLVMWSVSVMKESWYMFLMTVVLVSLERAIRGTSNRQRLNGLVTAIGGSMLMTTARSGGVIIIAAALSLALVGTFLTRRVYLLVLVVLLMVPVGDRLIQQPTIQAHIMPHVRLAAVLHVGHVNTLGHSYKTLDPRFYSGASVESMTLPEAQRFLLRALASFVVVPLPWESGSRAQILFIPQQVIWYSLLLLAVVGAVRGYQRDPFGTWLLVAITCVGAILIAPSEGNMGTLVRHRDSIVPFVICLASLGALSIGARGRVRAADSNGQSAAWAPFTPIPQQPSNGRLRSLFVHVAESSVVPHLLRESRVCGLIAALFKPTNTDGVRPSGMDTQWDDDLSRIAEGRIASFVTRAYNTIIDAWHTSCAATAVKRFRATNGCVQLRMAGTVLLFGTSLAGLFAQFDDDASGSVFVWVGTLCVAVLLMTASRPLAAAWRDRRAAPAPALAPEVEARPQLELA